MGLAVHSPGYSEFGSWDDIKRIFFILVINDVLKVDLNHRIVDIFVLRRRVDQLIKLIEPHPLSPFAEHKEEGLDAIRFA